MKISQEEINAAICAMQYKEGRGNVDSIRDALEAAYRVRKERKKANREAKLKSRTIIDMDEMLRTHDEWDKMVFGLELNEKTSP